MKTGFLIAGALMLATTTASAQTLRIGLVDDPDLLDPAPGKSFVGRIVFQSLCDKLVDASPELKIVPRLALSWETTEDGRVITFKLRDGVTFQDGEKFDAASVKFNIERDKTMPESIRKSELASVDSVEVIDPLTVRFNLKKPDASLLATLTDRAGMMVAPEAAKQAGAKFGLNPVCSGPYKFVERVQQDHITLERNPNYWNAKAYFFDKIVFRTIPDSTARLASLRSGDLDVAERIEPTDVKEIEAQKDLKVVSATSLGYQGLTVNVANGSASKAAVGQDKRVRQALSLAIDRQGLMDAVFDGQFTPGIQAVPPVSPFYSDKFPTPPRDVEKAKSLLKAAGVEHPVINVIYTSSSRIQRVAEVIQAMAADAGIELKLISTEFATQIQEQTDGNFETSLIGWSGRPDPDGNIYSFYVCGGGLNDGHYCNKNVDAILNETRLTTDLAARKALYEKFDAIALDELPIIYLYFDKYIWGMTAKLQGFVAHPDGMIRLENVKLAQ
ncbi:MAG: ABC transporter substrate-binding protein [Hyphomicrobiales bacterium]|nr:ABC transporter substrate-binding protein [Hyphomicrobiales bacterium]MBV9977964.1 ABC transporter substrate-binding protein [Hyphomicrobiales bacterium]